MTDKIKTPRRPTLLVILDGFGINPDPVALYLIVLAIATGAHNLDGLIG